VRPWKVLHFGRIRPSRTALSVWLAIALGLAVAWAPRAAHAQEEVPFITSPDAVTLEMLRSADVKASDFVIDLGSGDGRIVITAARLFGARGLGVEIVPDLVQKSRDNARRAGVEDRAEFREQDLFGTDLAPASVVTLYLLPEVNLQLRPALLALKAGTRVVSHDWDMGDWRPDRTTELEVPEKQVGREKKSRVHLWIVPARVAGDWCGVGPLRDARLSIEQRHQSYAAALRHGPRETRTEGLVRGDELRPAAGSGEAAMPLRLEGEVLRGVHGRGAPVFRRC
jgi:SAM-dependent methyltransferase